VHGEPVRVEIGIGSAVGHLPTLPGVTDPLHTWSTGLLSAWDAPDHEQDSKRRSMLAHLDAHPDGMRRSCGAGHLTGSALVVDAGWTRGLLHLHKRLARWLQMGGHTDDADATLAATALREATEESGMGGLRLASDRPVDLDIHPLHCPAGVPNRHLDVRWLVVAPTEAVPVQSTESLALRWFPLDDLASTDAARIPDAIVDDSVRRLARLALALRP
jgi:8-oxo-dGTP pyrophosphatase MutT (NUDIX family)